MDLPSKEYSTSDTSAAADACAQDGSVWYGSEANGRGLQDSGGLLAVLVAI